MISVEFLTKLMLNGETNHTRTTVNITVQSICCYGDKSLAPKLWSVIGD